MSQLLMPALAVLLPAFACPPQSDSAPQTSVNVPALVASGLNYLTSVAAPAESNRVQQKSQSTCCAKTGVSEPTIITADPAQRPLVIRAAQPTTLNRVRLVKDPTGQYTVIQAPPKGAPKPADDDDDDDAPRAQAAHGAHQGGPWLGIQFGPIPDALAAHLTSDGGLLVLNVIRHSPADTAGIKQYDVITRINDRKVESGEIKDFQALIKDLKAGEDAKLRVIRGGKAQTVDLTLGKRPQSDDFEYKYQTPPGAGSSQTEMVQPHFFEFKNGQLVQPGAQGMQRFQQLFQDKNGNWVFKTPQGGQGGTSVMITQSVDGETIAIRQDAGGQITVTRTGKNGKVETKTYDSTKDLEKGDPDAYKLYEEKKPTMNGAFMPFGGQGGMQGFQFGDPASDKQFREMMKQMQRGQGWGPRAFGGAAGRDNSGVSFQRRADGSIKVTTRGDGDTIIETFKNENELKRERPDLFKRYAGLKERPAQSESKDRKSDKDDDDDND
jgi:hypothetical protein